MYRFVFLLFAVFALSACGSSRPDGDRPDAMAPPAIDTQVDSLTARLSLDEDQQVSIREALELRAQTLRGARGLPTRRDRRIAMERAQTETDARIAAALTRDQRSIYDEVRAERAAMKDPQVERQLAQLREPLALTDDQEIAIASILERQADEIETLIDVYLRKGGQDVNDVREEIRAIRDRYDLLIETELSEEQVASFRREREEQRNPRGRRRR